MDPNEGKRETQRAFVKAILSASTYNRSCMQTSARRAMALDLAKADQEVASDADSDQLTAELTRQLQFTAVAK